MILRHYFIGPVLLSIALFANLASSDVLESRPRVKRDDAYRSDPKTYLDQVIDHWLYQIPHLIDISVAQSEKDTRLEVAKKVTQGWSIVIASWKDILSDYVANNRTLGNLGDMTVVYNYGFLFTYGIGFGYPLLLGLPDDTKSCGRQDFAKVLYEYQLQDGVNALLRRGASVTDLESVVTEFEALVGTVLSCIDNAENVESQIVVNAVANLIAAMRARLTLVGSAGGYAAHGFQARKLDFEEELTPEVLVVKPEVQSFDGPDAVLKNPQIVLAAATSPIR